KNTDLSLWPCFSTLCRIQKIGSNLDIGLWFPFSLHIPPAPTFLIAKTILSTPAPFPLLSLLPLPAVQQLMLQSLWLEQELGHVSASQG
uniref:Uncharacterized protein n=1 Tax=Fundulus heteroclitus TaxID=8078 RepID=A0A3Q2NRM8_FUNHE